LLHCAGRRNASQGEHGATVIHDTPGTANVIVGQTGIFRTYDHTAEQTVCFSAGLLLQPHPIPEHIGPCQKPGKPAKWQDEDDP
jgi:hypothetical protein